MIDAEPVNCGFMPAFIGACSTRVVVEINHLMPSEEPARNCLDSVLWSKHLENRVNLKRQPYGSAANQRTSAFKQLPALLNRRSNRMESQMIFIFQDFKAGFEIAKNKQTGLRTGVRFYRLSGDQLRPH